MRIEFGLDVGAFGPFPELDFFVLAGFGFFEGETLLFQGEATSAEITPAQGNDVAAQVRSRSSAWRVRGGRGAARKREKAPRHQHQGVRR
jgi:hypothetical protein